MGQKIHLNEAQLKRIISESVKKTLSEKAFRYGVDPKFHMKVVGDIEPEDIVEEVLNDITPNDSGLYTVEQVKAAIARGLEYQQDLYDEMKRQIEARDESDRFLRDMKRRSDFMAGRLGGNNW